MVNLGLASVMQYAVNEIRSNGQNPNWWRNRINDRINRPIQQAVGTNDGVALMDEDWDTLIILDACRADTFESVVGTDEFDEYRRVKSKESATTVWSRKNFPDTYRDTVYVSGNPVPSRHIGGEFVNYEEVWRDAFDDELGTVEADVVTEATLEAHKKYPNKRLIVHYMQPHYPFVGHDFDIQYWNQTEGMDFGTDDRARDIWGAVGLGIVDEDEVWTGYEDNLRYVMEDVWSLVEALDGRTVVHSDHGNVIGQRSWPIPVRTYGHPPGIRIPDLRTVPWAVIEGDERRTITDGEIRGRDETEDEDITEKLAALGYAESTV